MSHAPGSWTITCSFSAFQIKSADNLDFFPEMEALHGYEQTIDLSLMTQSTMLFGSTIKVGMKGVQRHAKSTREPIDSTELSVRYS